MLVSEQQEFEIGQKIDGQVREQMGVYLELPELRSFVKQVGRDLGRNSDRPNLIYRIEIVDRPEFNAFAAPGGFIYVHRGLLERVNSADELASVLGHEIAHVAARHSAAQISKAQLFNFGMLGLAVATKGAVQDYGSLINLGAVLAFNKFSRDDEREADHFGTAYLARAGYNPRASIDLMNQLLRLQVREPTALETWFMTHPPPRERLVNIDDEIQQVHLRQPGVLSRPVGRNQYVALLDGLAVGEWNGNELLRGDRYYNKEFLVSIRIPAGWQARISSKTYTGIFADPKREFYAFFDIEPLRALRTSAEYFYDFERRLSRLGLRRVKDPGTGRISRHGALVGIFQGYDQRRGSILAEGIAFVRGTNGYSLVGFSGREDFREFQSHVEGMMDSLRFISQKQANELSPPRLRIHELKKGETWESITKRYFESARGMDRLAEYNGFQASFLSDPGTLLKIPPSLRIQ